MILKLWIVWITLRCSESFVLSPHTNGLASQSMRIRSSIPRSATPTASSDFPFTEDQLIARAKEIIGKDVKFGVADNGECLADNFQFIAAVVGPLNKKDYLSTTQTALPMLEDAMELSEIFFGFHGDPEYPNRVWFMTRQQARHTKGPLIGAEPSGELLVLPPQTMHLDFDENLKVTEYGLYTADRNQGNTGGLGGLLGYFYGVGRPLPYPEALPYKMSWQMWLANKIFPQFPSQSKDLKIKSVRE